MTNVKLRVTHMPQVGTRCPAFHIPVASVAEAKLIMDTIAAYDLFQLQHHIKPDFASCSCLEVWNPETQEWDGWEFETGPGCDEYQYFDDVDEYCAEYHPELTAIRNEIFSQIDFNKIRKEFG